MRCLHSTRSKIAQNVFEHVQGLRRRIWLATWYIGLVLNAFIQFRFVQACLNPPPKYFVMDVAIHATIGWLGVATNVYAYNAFVKWPSVSVTVHRSMVENGRKRTEAKESSKFSMYQLVIFLLPTSYPTIAFIMTIAQSLRFDSPAFLWSIVPFRYRSPPLFYILFSIETFYRYFWLSYGLYGADLVVAMLERTNLAFTKVVSTHSQASLLHFLRDLEVEMLFLNLVTGHSSYVVKIYALNSSIIGFATTLHYFSVEPFLALVNVVYSTEVSIAYMAMYARAYSIPSGVRAVKRLALRCFVDKHDFKLFERSIAAISDCDMKMGSFHNVERETALIYWDFVVKQISVILISLHKL